AAQRWRGEGETDARGEEGERGGGGGAVPGGGGRPGDTEPGARGGIEANNCQIKTRPLAPPALSTPAGGTRRPSAPPGTSLHNATHLNSRSCFVLTRNRDQSQGGLPTGWLMPPGVFDAAAKPPILLNRNPD